MNRRELMRQEVQRLRELVGPGSIYNAAAVRVMEGRVRIGLERDGEAYALTVTRDPGALDAIELAMLAEAFGAPDGTEPVVLRRTGKLETRWQWRETSAADTQVRPHGG